MNAQQLQKHEREILIWLNSRTMALTLYGFLGMQVGLATIFTGTTPLLEQDFGSMIRLLIGGMAVVGGLLTFAGSLKGDRTYCGWWATLLGSSMLCLWAITGFLALVKTAVDVGVGFSWPWIAIDPGLVRLSGVLFYESILWLILLHVITLLRLGQPPRG